MREHDVSGTDSPQSRLKRCMRKLFAILTVGSAIFAASCAPQGSVDDASQDGATIDPTSLPAVLRDRSPLAMEALVSGKLTRRGACLYLEHAPGQVALILWGDDNVRMGSLDVGGGILNNYTTSQRLLEGDTIRGAGGFYAESADLARIAGAPLPGGCEGPAVQLYNVRKIDPSREDGAPPPPPPAPPPPSPLLQDAYREDAGDFAGPRRTIADVADPREAMFIHVLQDYRNWEDVHKCLRDADDALRSRLAVRTYALQPEGACGWNDGGVVLEANGERATYIDAEVDCSRLERVGYCAGSAGATYGNLGAEHNAYRLRPKGDGWQIERLGFGVIS